MKKAVIANHVNRNENPPALCLSVKAVGFFISILYCFLADKQLCPVKSSICSLVTAHANRCIVSV